MVDLVHKNDESKRTERESEVLRTYVHYIFNAENKRQKLMHEELTRYLEDVLVRYRNGETQSGLQMRASSGMYFP